MNNKSDKAIVIKIGGSTFGSHDTTIEDIVYLQKLGKRLVVIHGGANMVTEWMTRQGMASKMVRGERVTDAPTLDMVTAVLGGLANKQIAAAINGKGGRAVGISGVDGHLLQGKIRNVEMGYVGDIIQVDISLLETLLNAGFVPVIAPISFHAFNRSEAAPLILNINGDTAAGAIAAAIGAEKVIFLTDVDGIKDAEGKLIAHLTSQEAKALIDSGVASGGMVPKIKACLNALSGTAQVCIINGKQPHALHREIEQGATGTIMTK